MRGDWVMGTRANKMRSPWPEQGAPPAAAVGKMPHAALDSHSRAHGTARAPPIHGRARWQMVPAF